MLPHGHLQRPLHTFTPLSNQPGLAARIAKQYIARGQGIVGHGIQMMQHAPHVADHLGQTARIDRLVRLAHVPPHRRRQHGVAAHQALIVGRGQAAPLHEQILEVAVARHARVDVVERGHALFGEVGEVVDEVLVPGGREVRGEAAQADGQEPHVEEGDLGPGIEGWREAELWCWEGDVSC